MPDILAWLLLTACLFSEMLFASNCLSKWVCFSFMFSNSFKQFCFQASNFDFRSQDKVKLTFKVANNLVPEWPCLTKHARRYFLNDLSNQACSSIFPELLFLTKHARRFFPEWRLLNKQLVEFSRMSFPNEVCSSIFPEWPFLTKHARRFFRNDCF